MLGPIINEWPPLPVAILGIALVVLVFAWVIYRVTGGDVDLDPRPQDPDPEHPEEP